MTICSGSIQLGPRELHIDKIEDGKIHYRVTAPVTPHWGSIPKPGARWALTKGITDAGVSEAELHQRVVHLYGVGSNEPMLLAYKGPRERYPYQPAEKSPQRRPHGETQERYERAWHEKQRSRFEP